MPLTGQCGHCRGSLHQRQSHCSVVPSLELLVRDCKPWGKQQKLTAEIWQSTVAAGQGSLDGLERIGRCVGRHDSGRVQPLPGWGLAIVHDGLGGRKG